MKLCVRLFHSLVVINICVCVCETITTSVQLLFPTWRGTLTLLFQLRKYQLKMSIMGHLKKVTFQLWNWFSKLLHKMGKILICSSQQNLHLELELKVHTHYFFHYYYRKETVMHNNNNDFQKMGATTILQLDTNIYKFF